MTLFGKLLHSQWIVIALRNSKQQVALNTINSVVPHAPIAITNVVMIYLNDFIHWNTICVWRLKFDKSYKYFLGKDLRVGELGPLSGCQLEWRVDGQVACVYNSLSSCSCSNLQALKLIDLLHFLEYLKVDLLKFTIKSVHFGLIPLNKTGLLEALVGTTQRPTPFAIIYAWGMCFLHMRQSTTFPYRCVLFGSCFMFFNFYQFGPFSHTSQEPWPWERLWEPKRKCPKAVLQNHVVWWRTFKCSVKLYVTGPSIKYYFNDFSIHAGPHTW